MATSIYVHIDPETRIASRSSAAVHMLVVGDAALFFRDIGKVLEARDALEAMLVQMSPLTKPQTSMTLEPVSASVERVVRSLRVVGPDDPTAA